MGNISSNGVKSGTKINRECATCEKSFESWSDDTITIKGPMNPIKICDHCNKELMKNIIFFEKK